MPSCEQLLNANQLNQEAFRYNKLDYNHTRQNRYLRREQGGTPTEALVRSTKEPVSID